MSNIFPDQINLAACIVAPTTVEVTVESAQRVSVPWDGSSFSGASIPGFTLGINEFLPMMISGALLSSTSLQVTVATADGSTSFPIPFVATCPSVV